MSVSYTAVSWNRQKRIYDAVIVAAVLVFLGLFVAATFALAPSEAPPTIETTLIRALGLCALAMLHAALWIGPLARLDRRFLPLLYNRRHLGVLTFLIGLAHAAFSLLQYQGMGDLNPLAALLNDSGHFTSLARFPFEFLGAAALLILFIMAATSHDFWLRFLSGRVWKWLHMSVYTAYALLVGHVALGWLQSERSPASAALLLAGVAITCGLHVAAGLRESRKVAPAPVAAEFVDAGAAADIPESRAAVLSVGRCERIAVYKHEGAICAVSNVCEHQGGPLGEGKIIDGCITCPWHGWQYRPEDGQSPPPFQEKIATHRVRIERGRVLVDPRPLPPGTPSEPARSEAPHG